MILIFLILFPMVGGGLAWLVGQVPGRGESPGSKNLARWIAVVVLLINLGILSWIWLQSLTQPLPESGPGWIYEVNIPWIPLLGIQFHLGLDGLGLLLTLLSNFLGIMAIASSWKEIQNKVGFFHFNILWIVAALTGVFLALDLFVFYFFWEMMLVPLYFMIGIWGHENRIYAALKFFIFTQIGGLLMLLSILGLYFAHGLSTGIYTFDYVALIGTSLSPIVAFLLMMGFFLAFAVKLPVVPLHTWLPDAHTEAPTAGSVILAGLVLKAAGFGFIRMLVPLFPSAAIKIAPYAMTLGVIGILYGAFLAFAQTDLKRLVAYTSISHMGFVILGIFAFNTLALQGAIVIMLAHGISTGALFILVGGLSDRMHTRDLRRMGGLWDTAPRMGRIGLLFALASLGLPGLGNFIGEFLVLLGVYKTSALLAILATLGFIVATVYSLWMVQRIFSGPNKEGWKFPDLDRRELVVMSVLTLAILILGLYPQPVLNTSKYLGEMPQQYSAQVNPIGLPTAAPGGAIQQPASLSAQSLIKDGQK
jgi:NADH-quinone oxidoreductase subunit M